MTEAQLKAQKARVDTSQIFLTFMALVGDHERAAVALNLDPEFVRWLSESEGWSAKIQRVSLMSRGQRPGDHERGINRALTFVQAHQLRGIIDGILTELRGMTPKEVMEKCSTSDKFGNTHYSAKFLTDLTTAVEACSRISFVALADTVTERIDRAETKEGGGLRVSDLHAAIIAGLSNLGKGTAETIVLEQARKVGVLTETVGISPGTVGETQPVVGRQELPTSPSEKPEVVPTPEATTSGPTSGPP